jgi:ribosomal protein L28
MQCECCTSENNLNNILLINKTTTMVICTKCLRKIEKYHIPDSELQYIHNAFLSGQRKIFIK